MPDWNRLWGRGHLHDDRPVGEVGRREGGSGGGRSDVTLKRRGDRCLFQHLRMFDLLGRKIDRRH